MKARRIAFVLSFAVASCLAGCREPIVVDGFYPKIVVLNREASVRSGESLRFRIDSNHDTYTIESLVVDSRLDGDFPTVGRTYSSGEEFTVPVTVTATHRGTLAVRVGDPLTGKSVVLEGKYTAYNLAKFGLSVLTPVVRDGEDFSVRVSCSHDAFELRSVECPFVFEGYQAGRTYAVPASGYVDLVARKVAVRESGAGSVCLTVCDTESGTVQELSGTFEMRKPTVVGLDIVDMYGASKRYIYNHDNFYLRVYDTQDSFEVQDFYCEFGTLLSRGATYRVSSDGFYEVAARDVRVEGDHDGTVFLTLYDPVNGDTHRLSVDYSARVSQE